MTLMISSGWHIYNAAPFLPFRLPERLTLGGWLVVVHPSLVAIVPRTLRPMITGRA